MVCLHGRTTIHRHVGIAIKSIVNSDQHHPHSWSRRVLVHRLRRIYHRYLSRHRHSGLFFSSAETDLTPRADQRINYTPLMDNDLLCQSGHFFIFIYQTVWFTGNRGDSRRHQGAEICTPFRHNFTSSLSNCAVINQKG